MTATIPSNIAVIIIDKHSFYDQLKKGYMEDVLIQRSDAYETLGIE